MKRYILLIITALPLICGAQNYKKMSSYLRQMLVQNSLSTNAKGTGTKSVKHLVVMVKGPESSVTDYCLRHQGDLHICSVPLDAIAELSEDPAIERISAHKSNATATLERSAQKINIEPAWQGLSLPDAFLGKGTLVGVIDCGIDYRHPTFRSSEDGRLRIVRAWDMIDIPKGQVVDKKKLFPIGTFCNSEESIMQKGYSIDCDSLYHGTHTTSTAAGSGADTRYRGMAPEADIYSVCKMMSNNYSKVPEEYKEYYTTEMDLLAYQNIFDYADSIGKPCVISCSFGGSQDMTDADKLLDDYFSRMTGPGHIIVASAGNDGSRACYMPKSAATKSIGGRISCSLQQFTVNVSTKGKLRMHVTDNNQTIDTRRTYELDFLPGNTAEKSPSGLPWYDFFVDTDITLFKGMSISIYSGNNEFDPTHVGYDIFFTREDKMFGAHNYTVEFEGDGVEAEIFCQGGQLMPATNLSPTLTGALPNSGNLGSPGALPSTICVGSMTYTNSWTDYQGKEHSWSSGTIGKVSTFSSRGPTQHGFTKPEVMAPGNLIAAGMALTYFDSPDSKDRDHVVGFSEHDGKQYPWAVQGGTSMSTPMVAGTIALWLEADPTLTKEKIMEVIASTSRKPDSSLSYPNNTYGYGEIDAYRGLLYVLNMTGIQGLSENHAQGVTIRPASNGGITVTLADVATSALPLRVYSTGGTLLTTAVIPQGSTTLTIPLPGIHGIVAVQVGTLGSTLCKIQ